MNETKDIIDKPKLTLSPECLTNIDATSKVAWDESYRLKRSNSLWSDDAIPYMARAIELFKMCHCHTVVDMPCGDGRNTIVLAKEMPTVVAFDGSENALSLAQKRIKAAGPRNCVFIHGDIFHTQFQDDQFDGIFCWDLLGHIKATEASIKELVRICRHGGHIIASIFAMSDPNRGIEMSPVGTNEFIYRKRYFYRFYSKEDIEALLKRFPAQLVSLDLEVWDEPGHEGFREYPHTHHSWVFNLKKG